MRGAVATLVTHAFASFSFELASACDSTRCLGLVQAVVKRTTSKPSVLVHLFDTSFQSIRSPDPNGRDEDRRRNPDHDPGACLREMDLSGVDGRWDDGSNTTKSSMDEMEQVHAVYEERFQWPTSGRQLTRVAWMRGSKRRRWLGHGTRWTIARAEGERCNGFDGGTRRIWACSF